MTLCQANLWMFSDITDRDKLKSIISRSGAKVFWVGGTPKCPAICVKFGSERTIASFYNIAKNAEPLSVAQVADKMMSLLEVDDLDALYDETALAQLFDRRMCQLIEENVVQELQEDLRKSKEEAAKSKESSEKDRAQFLEKDIQIAALMSQLNAQQYGKKRSTKLKVPREDAVLKKANAQLSAFDVEINRVQALLNNSADIQGRMQKNTREVILL